MMMISFADHHSGSLDGS